MLPIQAQPSFCALDAEIFCARLRKSRYKESFAEVIQAMISSHPNAPVALVSKDGVDPIRGQAIALGKRFHLPFWMTRAKGIPKCGRIQAMDPRRPAKTSSRDFRGDQK